MPCLDVLTDIIDIFVLSQQLFALKNYTPLHFCRDVVLNQGLIEIIRGKMKSVSISSPIYFDCMSTYIYFGYL